MKDQTNEYRLVTGLVRRKPKVTIRQIGGDDSYQWCVIVDGRIKWDGMTRSEAQWRKRREEEAQ
jgi:hypothetical protein